MRGEIEETGKCIYDLYKKEQIRESNVEIGDKLW